MGRGLQNKGNKGCVLVVAGVERIGKPKCVRDMAADTHGVRQGERDLEVQNYVARRGCRSRDLRCEGRLADTGEDGRGRPENEKTLRFAGLPGQRAREDSNL